MAYDIHKTNGELLTIVSDRTLDNTTPIGLLGKNYSGYGEIMAENLVHMLENFSKPLPPSNPIIGQLWWNTNSRIVYLYTADFSSGNSNQEFPGWTPLGGLNIIGDNSTGFETTRIQDTALQWHPAIKMKINGIIVAILSSDTGTYVPGGVDAALASRFPIIGQGINMNDGVDGSGSEYGNFKIRGRAMEAEFADMAEIYLSDTELRPGDIVKLGGSAEITKTDRANDNEVFGVVSTAPGFLLNAKMKYTDNAYPVALKGRVPCLVKGPVKRGERIVASDEPGVGIASSTDYNLQSIIGRAIGTKDDFGHGYIEIAVGAK